jgi:predicted outer membrane repeat protein
VLLGIIVNQNAQANILYCVLSYNSGTSGGALFVDQAATIFVQESQFVSNKATNGGILNKQRIKLRMENTEKFS